MPEEKKPKAARSPNYPGINLKTAVERAKSLFADNGRHAVGEETVAKAWDLSHKSSTFRMTMAALRAFDLIGAEGSLVKLTPLALDIVADYPEGSANHLAAIQKAALSPKIHESMHKRYGATLPADDEVRRYLVRDYQPHFNDNTVGGFIAEYKATMAYAKINGDTRIPPAEQAEGDSMNAIKASSSLPSPSLLPSVPPGGRLRDLPVTLPTTLEIAVFRVPVPMTETDYKTLVSSLAAMKDTLVEKKK
jgi:hypothetical protein